MKNISLRVTALLIVCVFITITSCRKKDDPSCVAGSGGNVEIVVFAKHNGVILYNSEQHPDTAFVKFGSVTSPGTTPAAFDTYYVSEEGEDHIHLTNLHCGSYYIYRTAYDTTTNSRYTGGLGLNFTQTSGEVDTTITVN